MEALGCIGFIGLRRFIGLIGFDTPEAQQIFCSGSVFNG